MTSSTNVRDELLDVSDNLSVCLSKLSKLANQINTRKTSTEDQSSPDNDDNDDDLYANVNRIDLSGNHMREIAPFVWKIAALQELYINDNALRDIDERVSRLGELRVLDVSSNRVTSIEPLQPLQRLAVLIADKNRLKDDHFCRLRSLMQISLSNNDLGKVPEKLLDCDSLMYVDLSHNRIATLPESISRLTALEQLDLQGNQLRIIPNELAQLTNLVSLNFENNFVITLPDVFATYHQLQKADLKLVLSEMPFLSKITLDGNPCAQARPELRRGERRHSLDINSFLATPLRMPDETNLLKLTHNNATKSGTESQSSSIVTTPRDTLIKASSSSSSTNGGPSSGSGDPINDEWSAFLPSKTYEIEPSNKMYNEATKPMIEELSTDTYDYIQHYFGKEHYNFCCATSSNGPVVVSIRKDIESAQSICGAGDDADNGSITPRVGYYRALVRTRKGVERFFIPTSLVHGDDDGISRTPSGILSSSRKSGTLRRNDSKAGKKSKSAIYSTSEDALSSMRGRMRHRGLNLVRALKDLAGPLLDDANLVKTTVEVASKKLIEYENSLIMRGYKFGVVYAAPGQSTEQEILSNKKGSPAYESFLRFLGQKVALKGWPRYAGGLDTKSGSTGEYTLYTKFASLEFLFHVATLLPFTENDTQQLERKRHIGNDVVLIVFQEGNTPLAPDFMASFFNHIVIIVRPLNDEQIEKYADKAQPATLKGHTHAPPLSDDVADKTKNDENVFYSVNVASKTGVGLHRPHLPSPPVFRKGPYFREFLLTKLINTERSSYKAPGFSHAIERTRKVLLEDLVKALQKK